MLVDTNADAVDTVDSSGIPLLQDASYYVGVEENDELEPARSNAPPSSKRRRTRKVKS
uniref:Transposase n=1 Tax=Peronospora matthiolae TaxID=2874970 RepID=A0AAV1UZT2_9STRA